MHGGRLQPARSRGGGVDFPRQLGLARPMLSATHRAEPYRRLDEGARMDLLSVVLTVAFFVASWGLVALCDRM